MEETKPVGGVGAARNVLECQLFLLVGLREVIAYSTIGRMISGSWIASPETTLAIALS
jgi:hypothetical protein